MARTSAPDKEKVPRKGAVAGERRTIAIRCLSTYERLAREQGYACVAGVDEVGRGCLFGPVFAAAVILHPDKPVRGLHDSKLLDSETRSVLAKQIKSRCVAWAVAGADVYEIDQINIYQASRLAMKRAVQKLSARPDYLLIDALRLDLALPQRGLIGGDARCRAIAAASILAKVHRDECLDKWDAVFPEYHLRSNKGYATPEHRRALKKYGPTFMHRFSFEPVRAQGKAVVWNGYMTERLQGSLWEASSSIVEPLPQPVALRERSEVDVNLGAERVTTASR